MSMEAELLQTAKALQDSEGPGAVLYEALVSVLVNGLEDCGIVATHLITLKLLHILTRVRGRSDEEWRQMMARITTLVMRAGMPSGLNDLLKEEENPS